MGRQRNRKRLRVNDPTQHLQLRVPVSDVSGGQEGRIRDTTFAQQAKMVRCQPDSAQTTATVRPPMQLDDNAIVHVIHHKEVVPGVATRARNRPTITRDGDNWNPPQQGNSDVRNGSSPFFGVTSAPWQPKSDPADMRGKPTEANRRFTRKTTADAQQSRHV